MKYKIEKNTVQETLIIPLYARKVCSELYPNLYRDETAVRLIDGYWVGHTNAWTIPGTEDLKPYITAKDKAKKWLFGTVGMAVISAVLAAIMMIFIR